MLVFFIVIMNYLKDFSLAVHCYYLVKKSLRKMCRLQSDLDSIWILSAFDLILLAYNSIRLRLSTSCENNKTLHG